MYPKEHFFLGFFLSSLLFFGFESIGFFEAAIILFSSIFIDFDHYLYYVLRKKNLSLRKAYSWFVRNGKKYGKIPKRHKKKYYLSILIFHGIEPLLLLIILSFFSKIFFFIFLGFLLHLFSDVFIESKRGSSTNKFFLIAQILRARKTRNVEELKKTKILSSL
jgi:hypothetical protein